MYTSRLQFCLLLFCAVVKPNGIGGGSTCAENTFLGDAVTGIYIIWPATMAGQRARANCPTGTTGAGAYRQCRTDGSWESPDFSHCTTINSLIPTENTSLITTVSKDTIDWKTLETFKQGSPQNKTTQELTRTVAVLEEIVLIKERLNETADAVMTTIDVIMEMNETTLAANGNITSRVVQILDLLVENIPTDAKTKTKLLKSRYLVLQAIDANRTSFSGVSFGITAKGAFVSTFENSTTSIKLSPSVLSNALTELVRIGFIYYKNNKVFQEEQDKQKNYIPSKEVMSSSVFNVSTSSLSDPVLLKFPIQEEAKMENTSCVFWKEKARKWSSAGCSLCPQQSSKKNVQCCCSHLTSFAVLFSPEKRPSFADETIHDKILSIISYVGCVISLIGVFLTFLTYLVFRHLRKTSQQYILMQLCIAIALLLIVFMVGINSTNNTLGCQIVAVLLHYLTLVTVLWMGIEAYNLYLGIVKVYDTYHSKFMLKASVVGWGIPMLVVLATVIAATVQYKQDKNDDKSFAYGTENLCVLHNYLYSIIAWFVPVLAIILFNLFVFIRVIHRLRNSLAVNYSKEARKSKKQCLTAIAVMCLLGLTWLFGALAISDARIVFEYLFCIFNSLQGFFIFFFHCVRIKEVRSQWSLFVSGLGFSRKDSVSAASENCHPRIRCQNSKENDNNNKKDEENTPC